MYANLEVGIALTAAVTPELLWALKKPRASWVLLERAMIAYRKNPWPNRHLMSRVLPLALEISKKEPSLLPAVHEMLRHKLILAMLHYLRTDLRLTAALNLKDPKPCIDAVAEFGPWFPWNKHLLIARVLCHQRTQHPEFEQAESDLDDYISDSGSDFGSDLRPDPAAKPRAVRVRKRKAAPKPPFASASASAAPASSAKPAASGAAPKP